MYHVHKTLIACALLIHATQARAIDVQTLRLSRPFPTITPVLTDTTDVRGEKFKMDDILLDMPLPMSAWKSGEQLTDSILPANEAGDAVRLAGFQVETPKFAKCEVKANGTLKPIIYVDGKKQNSANLTPGRHDIVLKFIQKQGKADTLKVSVESKQEDALTVNPEGKRLYTLEDYLYGRRAGSTSLSASGRYVRYTITTTLEGGKTETSERILDLKDGREIHTEGFKQWASKGDNYIRSRKDGKGSIVYETVNPQDGHATHLFTDETASGGTFLSGERQMLIYKNTEGPKEDKQVFQILEPDDRIPGWRDRTNVRLLDVETGRTIPLTLGQHDVSAVPSRDGKRIILMVYEHNITQRPFTFTTALLLDVETMQTDTLVRHDGFVAQAKWAPDGETIFFSGSPEAFGGIGINDPTGKTPSMEQMELFEMNPTTKEVRSLSRDFDPNIQRWECSVYDGNIYALCENHDLREIFRLDRKNGTWSRLPLSEEYIYSFSLSEEKPLLTYTGQSHSNSDRIYAVDLKSGKERLLLDLNEERMGDIALGDFDEWNFQSSRGDTIYGRYYLPPHFDASRQYPMLVYYYGGCSPVGRYLESYYNFHGWAAMGYIVYVIQPSGATGFGQEFAARHVNAYGDYTADDIIEGTKKFCAEHPFVNSKKIGCLGASYGGFMTMYLQTKTDIFAAAMAHAGISNPASYWGYGYWGYSYNAVCAADSYPWNNPELYSGHAPLFNADKVHTPILFLHGGSDTNVPIVESTQMFNALKILGRDCAFVTVEGQNHHILEYERRIKWVYTFYAWFAKYLQDDPTWWETLYPTKNLK